MSYYEGKKEKKYKAQYMYKYKHSDDNPKYNKNSNQNQDQHESGYGGGNYQTPQQISYYSQDQSQSHQQQGQTNWQQWLLERTVPRPGEARHPIFGAASTGRYESFRDNLSPRNRIKYGSGSGGGAYVPCPFWSNRPAGYRPFR
jgi:hypothetical protein